MSKSDETTKWICSEFSRLLGIPSTDDLANYLMSMESSRDIEDYLQSILDLSNPDHLKFVQDLMQKLGHCNISIAPAITAGKFRDKPKLSDQNPKDINKAPKGPKSKAKHVNLFSAEGKAVENYILPGKHQCECQASKHQLIRNCLDCGRVICAQEGTGPCLFCSSQVGTAEAGLFSSLKEKNRMENRKGKREDHQSDKAALLDATAHKEKLLEYDRTSEHRTRVIDDESDYFNTNGRWLTPVQRAKLKAREEELRAKRFGSQRERKIVLDFAGRRVVEEAPNVDELFMEQKLLDSNAGYQEQFMFNPVVDFPRPIYGTEYEDQDSLVSRPAVNESQISNRLQDAELQKMSDQAKCLSMHQPYASLLVAGIKKHEGRSWYTSHRGRLWIASTAKVASDEEIKRMENFYRVLYGKELAFPRHYPSGSLLGCVEVVDVLSQEEYRLQYPNGESESPYVFICQHPCELFMKFPMKGQHKIYKLDSGIHQAAKKSLAFDSIKQK